MDIRTFFQDDRFARQTGIEMVEVRKGYAKVSMLVCENHLNAAHTTQGGAVFTLADFAIAVAANSQGKLAVSTNVNIHFIKGSQVGDTLFAEATENHLHKRSGIYQVEITNQRNELIALAQGVVFRKDEDLPTFEF